MKTRSSRMNNGYLGVYEAYDDTSGLISTGKKYNINNYTADQIWTRPSAWVPLPDVSLGEQKIAATYAVYDTDNNFLSFVVNGGNSLVDWGDGTTGSVNAGNAIYKNYTRSTYSGLTSEIYQGYKTLNVIITAATGQNWSGEINLAFKHNQSGLQSYYTSGWLDIKMSAPNSTSIVIGDIFNDRSRAHLLERFNWIGNAPITSYTFIGCSNLRLIENFPSTERVTNYSSCFHTCRNLEQIHPNCLNSRIATNWNFTFLNCEKLKNIPNINMDNATTTQQTFTNCYLLKRIPYINTSNSTNVIGMFGGCFELEKIPEGFDPSKSTSLEVLFFACHSLKDLPEKLNTSVCTNMRSMFQSTTQLNRAPVMDTSNVTDFSNMFNSSGVRIVPEYNYSKATTISSMFNSANRLLYLEGNTMNTGLSLTTADAVFGNCQSLLKVPNIQNITNVTNTTNMFADCRAVKEYGSMDWKSVTNTGSGTSRMFYQNWSLSRCQITGITATVSFESCSLGATALNEIYTNLGPGTGKTITVTGNWGTAADNTSIATGKGWTVTG